ncbi:MAG: hypothetical protein ACLT2Z_08110 [Eubacterium sp.]
MREKELAKVISGVYWNGVYSMWIETKAAQTAKLDSLFPCIER